MRYFIFLFYAMASIQNIVEWLGIPTQIDETWAIDQLPIDDSVIEEALPQQEQQPTSLLDEAIKVQDSFNSASPQEKLDFISTLIWGSL